MRNTSTWSGTCTASLLLDLIYNFKMSILEQVQFSNRARLKMDLENGETAPLQAARAPRRSKLAPAALVLAVLGGAALFSSAAPSARQIAANLSACSSPFACSDTDDSLNVGSKSDGGKHSKNKDLSTDDISDADRSSFFVDDGDSKA